jgi:hypothetical protein
LTRATRRVELLADDAKGQRRKGRMRILGLVSAVVALLFWCYSAFDMWATLTAWPPYVQQYGHDMFAWIQGFPIWRKLLWGVGIALGAVGALLMFPRARAGGDFMLAAVGCMVAGFSYDLVFEDGLKNYGAQGLIASVVLIALAAFLTWAAYATVKPRAVVIAPVDHELDAAGRA